MRDAKALLKIFSICALLVWFPDNPDDTITRLLFPGSTPQHKVIRGLDKLKDLEFMQKPVCSSGSYKQKDVKEKSDASKPSYKPASSIPPTKKLFKKETPGKAVDGSLNASKESIDKQESNKRMESMASKRSVASAESEEKKARDSDEKEIKQKKIIEKKERVSKPEKSDPKRDKSESKPLRKKVEEKEIKEQKNQAAGAVQAREKVSSASKPASTTPRSKLSDAGRSVRSKADTAEKVAKRSTASVTSAASRSAVSAAPSASKTKKEATNKTKKEEVSRTKQKESESKSIRPKVKPVGGKTSVAKTAAKTAAVGAAAAAVAAAVIDNAAGQDEEVESIVEKHQIEAMETSPIDDFQQADIQQQYNKEVEDDIEPELERIKDEEDDIQDVRVPDIPAEANQNIPEAEAVPVVAAARANVPKDLDLAEVVHNQAKPHVHHVKTPDEVDDLPEHEAVEPDENLIENTEEAAQEEPAEEEGEQEQEVEEEKIALDLQEKEQTEKKEDDEEKEQESKKSVESEGAQEQKEVGEMIVKTEVIQLRTPTEEHLDNGHEEATEPEPVPEVEAEPEAEGEVEAEPEAEGEVDAEAEPEPEPDGLPDDNSQDCQQ